MLGGIGKISPLIDVFEHSSDDGSTDWVKWGSIDFVTLVGEGLEVVIVEGLRCPVEGV